MSRESLLRPFHDGDYPKCVPIDARHGVAEGQGNDVLRITLLSVLPNKYLKQVGYLPYRETLVR